MTTDSERQANLYLEPGTLWDRSIDATAHALAQNALKPVDAVPEICEEAGIPFVLWRLRIAGNQLPVDRPPREKPAYSESASNPFLPYDPDIFVADITPTHVCLLNKFNVLNNHLIIVTRAFEHQTHWLTTADFEALWRCMREFDGLAFCNGGVVAGASQRHKHLQYVPFPLCPDGTDLPISHALAQAQWADSVGSIDVFSFVHAIAEIEVDAYTEPAEAADRLRAQYVRLLEACGVKWGDGETQTCAYNMLATCRWMMIIPRSRESYEGVSVNALGYAGSLLARNHEQAEMIRAMGPLSVLQHVSCNSCEGSTNYCSHLCKGE